MGLLQYGRKMKKMKFCKKFKQASHLVSTSHGRRSHTKTSDLNPSHMHSKVWDCIIVGGGHNGLTAAAYLAKSGKSTLVLERRHVIGGAAVTEEVFKGFKFSRASYLQSLLRPSVISELDLHRHGLELLPRNPSSFTPTSDGKFLLLGSDPFLNSDQISKFSKKDAEAYPLYEAMLGRFSELLEPLLDSVPPQVGAHASWTPPGSLSSSLAERWRQLATFGRFGRRAAAMGPSEFVQFSELLLAPASKILDRWFESDVLKATLATDAIIGAMSSPHTPGSGYLLLHLLMGESMGKKGVWSYVKGGMGKVSAAMAAAAEEFGAAVVTNAEVGQILVEGGKSVGVQLVGGQQIRCRQLLSNATPRVTFEKLLPEGSAPPEFMQSVRSVNYASAATKINLVVDKIPNFLACPGPSVGPQHFGTIHLGADSIADIHSAYSDAVIGQCSRRPIVEMTIPSTLDPTLAPPGMYVVNLFVQYTPFELKNGGWDAKETGSHFTKREEFAHRCFSLIDSYAPGFKNSVVHFEVLTPPDLENVFGLTGGNIFHGAMSLDSLFLLRPVSGCGGYRTPISGLYLCGAGAHPGGGVMGAAGRNAASVVINDSKFF